MGAFDKVSIEALTNGAYNIKGNEVKKPIRKIAVSLISVLLGGLSGLAVAAPMESVTGLDVHNTGAFMAALDRYFASNDARDNNVAIWAVEFAGESEISHLAIGDFEGYADYEKTTNTRDASAAWRAFVGSVTSLLDVESRLMAVERFREGSGWRQHGAMAAFVMTITDPTAYAAAFADFVDSTDNPGSVRLMELRFGGLGATHAVLISAANTTALNEYLDELLSSDEYTTFVRKVGQIRTIRNVQMLRRVKTYGN